MGQEGAILQSYLRGQPRIFRELEAGGLAGGLAKTCVAPLERTKILFQTRRVSKEMGILGTLSFLWKTEGIRGLFRGNAASVLRIMPYAAIHFSVYEHYRRFIHHCILHEHQVKQQQQQQHESKKLREGKGSKEQQEASVAVAGILGPLPSHDHAANVSSQKPAQTAEGRAAAVAAVVDRVVDESSASGSSIDVTAAMVAAETQLDEQELGKAQSIPPPKRPAPLHPIWDLVAGSLSGATAVLITYPLDLVRTRLAYATEGALSDGKSSSCSRNPVNAFAKSSQESANSQASNSGASNYSTANTAGINSTSSCNTRQTPTSSISSSSNAQTSNPSSFVSCSSSVNNMSHRHQHRHHSILNMMKAAVRAEGLQGLYKGVTPTLMGILPYAGLKFYVYQSLKHAYNRRLGSGQASSGGQSGGAGVQTRLPIPIMLVFGGSAGLLAQTVTYPLDIVRRQMQVEGLSSLNIGNPGPSSSTTARTAPCLRLSSLAIAKAIFAEDGARGLFRGLSVNYLKVVPSTAIGFTAYEHLKHYLDVVGNL